MYLLGYDIGSGSIKGAIIDAESHETVGIAQYPASEMDIISRQSGWAEQQPEVWWQYLCQLTRKLLFQYEIKPEAIKGIGISYQMHGLVLVDKEQRILRPSIIWCDSRAVAIGEQAFQELGQDFCLKHLLNSPGNFTASKLKWVKDNEPDIYHNIHKILLPGDYIAMKLTGEINTTISGLSEGIFWDFENRCLSQEVLDYYQLSKDHIPTIKPTFSIQGQVNREAADATGLKVGTPLTYRAGDQPNNALALNVLKPGEIAATSGTSGVVYGIVDQPIVDPKSRINAFAHVNYEQNYDRIGTLLCINGAGIQYSWMKHQVARSGQRYSDMERMVSTVPVGSDGLCILPFGNGAERIFDNKDINAHFFNLKFNRHTRAHMYRASLEGVAFSFVYGINMLKKMGLNVDVFRVGNDNMFQSGVFSMTIATLLGSHIEVVETTGAVGAARGAGVAADIYSSLESAVEGIRPSIIYEPKLNLATCKQAYHYWQSCLEGVLNGQSNNSPNSDALAQQNETLVENLKVKNKEITAKSIEAVATTDLLKEVQKTLQQLNPDSLTQKDKRQVKQLNKRIISHLEGDQSWEVFKHNFNLLYSDFFRNIKAEFPELTLPELKLCAFLKMNLTTKEVANRLNLSVRGVETRRYRLRKKFGLPKNVNLIQFIERF
jgi:xylulokinase